MKMIEKLSTELGIQKKWVNIFLDRVLVRGKHYDQKYVERLFGIPIKVGDQAYVLSGRNSAVNDRDVIEQQRALESAEWTRAWIDENATPELLSYYYPGMDTQAVANKLTAMAILELDGNATAVSKLSRSGGYGPVKLPSIEEIWQTEQRERQRGSEIVDIPLGMNADPRFFADHVHDLVLPFGVQAPQPLMVVGERELKERLMDNVQEGILRQQGKRPNYKHLKAAAIFNNGEGRKIGNPSLMGSSEDPEKFYRGLMFAQLETERRMAERSWQDGPLAMALCVDDFGLLMSDLQKQPDCGQGVLESLWTTMNNIQAGAWGFSMLFVVDWETASVLNNDPWYEGIAGRCNKVFGKPREGSRGEEFLYRNCPNLFNELASVPEGMVVQPGVNGTGYERFWVLKSN